jgi:lipopolysaccharide transport system permease protein
MEIAPDGIRRQLRSMAALVAWDLRERTQSSVLGLGWTLVNPFMRILIFYGVFFQILGVHPPESYARSGPGLWITAGFLPWLWVADTLGRAPGLVLERVSVFRNGSFPGLLLSPMSMITSWVYHAVGLAVLFALVALRGQMPGLEVLGCLPWMLAAGLLSLGLSWFASALHVYGRDTAQVMSIALNVWVYATPIVYPRHLAPAVFQPFLDLNPMTHIVEGYRSAWLGAGGPLWQGFAYTVFVACSLSMLGYLFFRRLQPGFAEEL